MERRDWRVIRLAWPSPLFAQAVDLRFRVLHEPFGVTRDDEWHDDDPDSLHVVAVADDRVVGYARLILEEGGETAQVRQVAVEPAWERRGIGSALVRDLVDEARDRGMRLVWLNARVTALPFYERLGFKATGEEFASPRTWLPHKRMERVP
jgi:GNAT superfamily N-acetyltransferase